MRTRKIGTWLDQQGQNGKPIQKRIVTNRVANGNALLRMYNIQDQKDLAAVSCVSVLQIVEELVFAWYAFQGELKEIHDLDAAASAFILHDMIQTGEYPSIPEESRCIRTSEEVLRILNQLRMNELKAEFRDTEDRRAKDLREMMAEYEKKLAERDLYDNPRLLKRGIEILEAIEEKTDVITRYLPWTRNCRFAILQDEEWTGKEREFLDKLVGLASTHDDEEAYVMLDFYADTSGENPNVKYEFFNAYGAVNEVRHVADWIEGKNDEKKAIPYGEVQVFYTSAEYEPFIRSVFGSRKIPYRFVSGRRVADTDMVRFMISVLDFIKDDYLYKTLYDVIDNPSMTFYHLKREDLDFDIKNSEPSGQSEPDEKEEAFQPAKSPRSSYRHFLRKGIGWGKQRYLDCIERTKTDPSETKKYCQFLAFLSELVELEHPEISCGEFYRNLLTFTKKFCHQGQLERQTLGPVLKEQIRMFDQVSFTGNEMLEYVRDSLAQLTVEEARDMETVQIVCVNHQEILERPYNFFIGMSAKQFQVDATESPVLSDQELQNYMDGNPVLAREAGERRRKAVECTLNTLRNGMVIMGYSTFDTVDLKSSTSSVFYLQCMERAGQKKDDIKEQGGEPFGIVEGPIRISKADVQKQWEAQAQNDGEDQAKSDETLSKEEEVHVSDDAQNEGPLEISATRLQTLVQCPFKYYYQNVLYIPSLEFQEKKPYQWLSALQKGNLFHGVVDEYCKQVMKLPEYGAMDEACFKSIYQKHIDQLVLEQPYVSEAVRDREVDGNKKVISEFLKGLHEDLQEEIKNGVISWRIGDSELEFKDLMYTVRDETGKDTNLKLALNGFIDRLDYCIVQTKKRPVTNTLYLRIVDYKTGRRKDKLKEIKNYQQLQHFIYAMAALKYANDRKSELEEDSGKVIHEVVIKNVQYIFPYEEGDKTVIEVTNAKSTTKEIKELLAASEVRLPEMVDKLLRETLGCLQADEKTLRNNMEQYMQEREKNRKGNDWRENPCIYCEYNKLCGRHIGTEK